MKKNSALYFWYGMWAASVGLAVADTKMVVAVTDTRNYSLTVSSPHGTPVPGTATNYAWASTVTCLAPDSVEQGVLWRCTGWTGAGSVPASGATNTTGEIVLTNLISSIAWNWGADFSISNVVAHQRPGTKLVDITYDLVSDVTNGVPVSLSVFDGTNQVGVVTAAGDAGADVLPGENKTIEWNAGADWNLEQAILTFQVAHSIYTQLFESVSSSVDTLDYRLTVRSVPDSGVSVTGTHAGMTSYSNALAYATEAELIAPLTYMRGSDRMRFAGWSGSITSSALTVNFIVTNHQEVVLLYGMERYLNITASQNGRINPAGTVAVPQGYPQTFVSIPDSGYRLKHWLVDGEIVGKNLKSLTVDVSGDMTIAAVFEAGAALSNWLVFEGRSQGQRVDETGGKRGEPVVLKETLSTLLVVNRDRPGETNAVLVSWGKSGVQTEAVVAVSMDDSYLVSAKNDKSGRPAAERNLWSLSIRDASGKSLLIGTFDGAYRYDKSGVLIRVQQRASLNGAGLSPEDPSFNAGLLRLNQTAGDALNKQDGNAAAMAAALRTQIKKLPAGVSDGTLGGLLQEALGLRP